MMKEEVEDFSIVSSLYKLLISRQRLPRKHVKLSKLMAKGRRRAQDDLDVVNQARNTQRIKAMSQILLTDQQRMILQLNKRTLLEDAISSEPMTETPDNSEGETIAEKLSQNMKFTGQLQKNRIDEDEANRRAIMSVTKRRFRDEDVTEEAWRDNYEEIVAAIQRKVYEDPIAAIHHKEEMKARLKEQSKTETPPIVVVESPILSDPKMRADSVQDGPAESSYRKDSLFMSNEHD